MKLFSKKIIAMFMSVAMILGLCPLVASSVKADVYSAELIDYQSTYYNGFNDDIAVAKGTTVVVDGGDVPVYFTFKSDLKKTEGAKRDFTLSGFSQYTSKATVTYTQGKVMIKVSVNSVDVFEDVLYTPQYVDVNQMPTIKLGDTIGADYFRGKTTEQFFRVDQSTLTGTAKAYTVVLDIEDEEDEYYDIYNDTELTLYDAMGGEIDSNDDTDEETEDIDSALRFDKDEDTELILGVRDVESEPFANVQLKLTTDAKSITSFRVANLDEVNEFYEGINDNRIYNDGTKFEAKLDNGETRTYTSFDYEDEYDEVDDICYIAFDEVEAVIYRESNGDVYARYNLVYSPDDTEVVKLFTPVVKKIEDIPDFEAGDYSINTVGSEGAGKLFKVTTGDLPQKWTITATYKGDNEEYEGIDFDVYDAQGNEIESHEQPYDEESEELEDLEMEILVPANTTYIFAISDYAETPQEIGIIAAMETQEVTTTQAQSETVTQEVTTTEAPTTEAPTAETTVAPTQQTTAKKVVKKPAKVKIKKVYSKKKSAKKLKLKLKKAANAKGYQVAVFKSKKLAKKAKKTLFKKFFKNVNVKLNSKKLKGKKKLFVRARAYNLDGKTKVYGAWSAIKTVKAK